MVLSAADRFGDAGGRRRLWRQSGWGRRSAASTFTELAERIRKASGAFAEFGVDKGDRVAVWAPNSAEWIIAAFGIMAAGGVLVPVNTRFKAEEAADVVVRSGAKAVMVQNGFLGQDFAFADDRSRCSGHRSEVGLPE